MNIKIAVVGVAVLIGAGGCATQQQLPDPNLNEKFRAEAGAALTQPMAEMKIAALKALQPPDRKSAMLRDATILHLALLGRPSVFIVESKALLATVADMWLHEIPLQVQVLVHLSARINGVDGSKYAAGEIRQAVDHLCGPRTRERYAAMSGDLVTRRRQLFDASAAAACFAAVSGRENEAYLALVDAAGEAYGDAVLQRELAEVGLDRTVTAATKLFVHRLRRTHGIDLNLLLTL